ncbi:hypothetical protein [Derxia lacustris]|uniref:hypothetical protein n=1 Tax=Derxia lacustris TaxID=764842 RepID=UPI000A17164D|nr:hypothetical protein [Derxia lacustris]
MKRWSSLLSAAVFAAGFVAADAHAITSPGTLYAIGSDANGVGRTLSAVDPLGAGTDLGDGSLAFNGLAFLASTGRAYTVGNDSFGNSFLTSFLPTTPSVLAPTVALGSGFYGGLAASGSQLYAIGSSSAGASSLYSVGSGGASLLGGLGSGFYGGLTWNAGALYAIGGDEFGVQRRFSRIDLAGGTPTVTTLFDLGDGSLGFQGGLAFDTASNRFVTIANDGFGASSLYGFSLAGASSLSDLGKPLGSGFVNGGLAYLAAPVPEAPFALLFALGLPVLLVARSRRNAR